MSVWKCISSAPKNCEKILLYCHAKGPYIGSWDTEGEEFVPSDISTEECSQCYNLIPNPRFWCEIPTDFHM